MTPADTRAVTATIRHDVKSGNLEHARRCAARIFEGDWSSASPDQLEQMCLMVEGKLNAAGVR